MSWSILTNTSILRTSSNLYKEDEDPFFATESENSIARFAQKNFNENKNAGVVTKKTLVEESIHHLGIYTKILEPDVTARTFVPDSFFRNFKVDGQSFGLTGESFEPSDIELIYQMIDQHPVYEFSLFSFFGLEFFKHFQALKNLNCNVSLDFRNKWISSWQSVYAQLALVFSSPCDMKSICGIILEGDPKLVEIGALRDKLSKIFGLLKKNLSKEMESNTSAAQDIDSFLTAFGKTHDLLMKCFSHSMGHYLLHFVLVGECAGMNVRRRDLQDAITAASELNKFIMFINESVLTEKSISPVIKVIFQNISNKKALLDFDMKNSTEIIGQCHELIEFVGEQFLKVFSAKVMTSKGLQVAGTATPTEFDCALTWLRQILDVLMTSILPGLDPVYKNVKSYEIRMESMFENIKKILDSETKRLKQLDDTDGPGLHLLKNTHNRLFKKIHELRADFEAILRFKEITREYNFCQFPFVIQQLKTLSDKLKPLINYVLKELAACINKYSDELRVLPLLEMTEEMGKVFNIIHHIDLLLHRKNPELCIFPLEYVQLISLENIEDDNGGLNEEMDYYECEEVEEKKTVDLSDFMASPAKSNTADNSDEPTPIEAVTSLASLSPRSPSTKRKESSSFSTFVNAQCVQESQEMPEVNKIVPSEVSMLHLHRAYTRLGLKPKNGGRHTKWVDANGKVWTMAPRARKPGRGLQRAMNKQVLKKMEAAQAVIAAPLEPVLQLECAVVPKKTKGNNTVHRR